MASSPPQYGETFSNTNGSTRLPSKRLYSLDSPPSLADFTKLCSQSQAVSKLPLAEKIETNIPIYNLSTYHISDTTTTYHLQDEWYSILLSGPGVFVLENFLPSPPLLDIINTTFSQIISNEEAESSNKGDHFASAGKDSRIWNSFQKLSLHEPTSFVQYYSNPWLSLASEAWLGPGYQITAQVNIVKPGGQPQAPHRDYHLGFQSPEKCVQYPKTMQIASQFLTLQGAIAHSEMSLESGPMRFLPFSQMFEEGYLAWRLPEFKSYFEENWVSLPLQLGDAVFFNPAIFHAAGENRGLEDRSANLLQISSAFGKPMEKIDNIALLANVWEEFKKFSKKKETKKEEVEAFVEAIASGYPFPTNLDNRAPAPGGMAPSCEADMVFEGLRGDWSLDEVLFAVGQLQADSFA